MYTSSRQVDKQTSIKAYKQTSRQADKQISRHADKQTPITMESKNRHKTVRCKVCSKSMRSDHLKRHSAKHKDILAMSDDKVREELRARHSAQLLREERQQAVEEIAQQENIPIDYRKTST